MRQFLGMRIVEPDFLLGIVLADLSQIDDVAVADFALAGELIEFEVIAHEVELIRCFGHEERHLLCAVARRFDSAVDAVGALEEVVGIGLEEVWTASFQLSPNTPLGNAQGGERQGVHLQGIIGQAV